MGRQTMNHNHRSISGSVTKTNSSLMKWLGICVGIAIIALIAISVFKVSINSLVYGAALLACPLIHIWMMKNGNHKH